MGQRVDAPLITAHRAHNHPARFCRDEEILTQAQSFFPISQALPALAVFIHVDPFP
jgi:hypothetical protein